jgi:hypothetical protein
LSAVSRHKESDMMQNHPDLKLTIPGGQRLFKYMDVYKLLFLLASDALYFSTLATMQDIFEGLLTDKTMEQWLAADLKEDQRKIVVENINKMNSSARAYLKICCFSISDIENEILWDHYGHSEYSVCLQTTLDRVTDAFKNTAEDVSAGEIEYINRNEHVNKSMNLFNIASFKSEEYGAERELRLFMLAPVLAPGIALHVDVPTFVERIIVSPKCRGWRFKVVQDLVAKYSQDLKVEPSRIVYQGST